jgi:hypothetical protein
MRELAVNTNRVKNMSRRKGEGNENFSNRKRFFLSLISFENLCLRRVRYFCWLFGAKAFYRNNILGAIEKGNKKHQPISYFLFR